MGEKAEFIHDRCTALKGSPEGENQHFLVPLWKPEPEKFQELFIGLPI